MRKECEWFSKHTTGFLKDTLSNEELEKYLKHAETCEDCKKELSIALMIGPGMEKLERGEVFHLKNELEEVRETAFVRLKKRKQLFRTATWMEILAILAIACAVVAVLIAWSTL